MLANRNPKTINDTGQNKKKQFTDTYAQVRYSRLDLGRSYTETFQELSPL